MAFGPLAVYLMLLGTINLARRPHVVSGGRDTAALTLALAGLMIVGPIELFFPYDAAVRFGAYVWLLLLALYAMCVVLVLLSMRPRLVIYNMHVEQLRPVLAAVVEQLDPQGRWAGDSLALPGLGVQLHIESFSAMRNVSLVSAGRVQNHAGWARLDQALRAALAQVEVSRNPRGLSLLSGGLLVAVAIGMLVYRHPEVMTQQLTDVLGVVKKLLVR